MGYDHEPSTAVVAKTKWNGGAVGFGPNAIGRQPVESPPNAFPETVDKETVLSCLHESSVVTTVKLQTLKSGFQYYDRTVRSAATMSLSWQEAISDMTYQNPKPF